MATNDPVYSWDQSRKRLKRAGLRRKLKIKKKKTQKKIKQLLKRPARMLQLESFFPPRSSWAFTSTRKNGFHCFVFVFFFLFCSQLALTRLLLTAGCAVTCHRAMLCIKSRISHIGKDPLSNISVYPISSHPIRFPPRLSAQVEGRDSDRFAQRSVRRISFPCAAEPPLSPPSFSREHLCGGRRSSVSTSK